MELNILTDERNKWRRQLETQSTDWDEPIYLQDYRLNRNSDLWRSTRALEKLCEYILYLEATLKTGVAPMTDEIKIALNNDSLATLLRSNLSCHMGKMITQESLGELTNQIIESIEFFLNKKEEVRE